MFKLIKNITAMWPVIIPVPVNGGKVKNHKINVLFTQVDQDVYDEISKKDDIEFLMNVITGWDSSVADGFGEPLEFNDENLESLVKIAYVRLPLINAFHNFYSGKEEKNLERQPDTSGTGSHRSRRKKTR